VPQGYCISFHVKALCKYPGCRFSHLCYKCCKGNTLHLSANLRREGIIFVEENQLPSHQQQETVAPPPSLERPREKSEGSPGPTPIKLTGAFWLAGYDPKKKKKNNT
jgi:hypothetical protein